MDSSLRGVPALNFGRLTMFEINRLTRYEQGLLANVVAIEAEKARRRQQDEAMRAIYAPSPTAEIQREEDQ
jgi:hypothetical protein